MFGEEITILKIVSVTATISTVSLFLCGLPICYNIWKRKSTKDISSAPFLIGFLGGSYWLRYGVLKEDYTMIVVNVIAVTLMATYLLFFYYFTQPKLSLSVSITVVLLMISLMAYLVEKYSPQHVINPLGMACMTFNIISFGAPLAGLRVVIQQHCCETLPLPMCIGNFLVSSQWCLYGILSADIYLIVPNAIGVTLAAIQISLFFIFPLKPGQEALFGKLCKNQIEVEKGEAQPKKSWIPHGITEADLGQFEDPKHHIRLDKKRSSCFAAIDSSSLTDSESTETTDLSPSQSVISEKESISEKPEGCLDRKVRDIVVNITNV